MHENVFHSHITFFLSEALEFMEMHAVESELINSTNVREFHRFVFIETDIIINVQKMEKFCWFSNKKQSNVYTFNEMKLTIKAIHESMKMPTINYDIPNIKFIIDDAMETDKLYI